MPTKVDPAILKALNLDSTNTTISKHGSSGFAGTFKLVGRPPDGGDRREKCFFVKTGGEGSEGMFAGEHASLNAIHSAVPNLCPRSYAHGPLSASSGYFLATDFLALSPPSSTPGSSLSLASKLATLHSTPAPIPDGYSTPQFGFPVPTCCGDTVQDNGFRGSWAGFYAENRLLAVLKAGEERHGPDPELRQLVETTASTVVPRLLANGHLTTPSGGEIEPVVVHGDLWSGNHGKGRIGDGEVGEVIFDPAASYSHSEFEFGIMRMFGGFGGGFGKAYWREKPRDEPVGEWEDRVSLYELYHHLNHYSIFGGGYKGGAVSIMRRLIGKYGEEDSGSG